MPEVNIEFSEDGSSEVEVNGVKGKSCTTVSKPYTDALGETTEEKKTREFYEKETTRTQNAN